MVCPDREWNASSHMLNRNFALKRRETDRKLVLGKVFRQSATILQGSGSAALCKDRLSEDRCF
jgi:hypothetical protein